MRFFATLLLAVLCFAPVLRAEDLKPEDAAKVEASLKALDSDDAAARAAAETDLRNVGFKALPALLKAKLNNAEATVRLRAIIVDLAVDGSGINPTDALMLAQIAREEAIAKRWSNAIKTYRRTEKVYEKLHDDAKDRKDKAKANEYEDLAQKADKRADRAEHIQKGDKGGLNLGIVRVGPEHDLKDDDW